MKGEKMMVKTVYGTILMLLIISISPIALNVYKVEASPKTWTVDDDLQEFPDADFTKIQDAIAAAASGDVILVYPGMYVENIDIDKSIVVMSEGGPNVTSVQALDPSTGDTFRIDAEYVEINGFKIERTLPVYGGLVGYGIRIAEDNSHITNNIILGNGSGIGIAYSLANLVENNTFINCPIGISYFGYQDYFYGTMIKNNLFLNCDCGISLYAKGDTIKDNIFLNNSYAVRLGGANNTAIDNIFENCGIVTYGATHIIENNTVNEKPIYYYTNTRDIVVPGDGGQFIIVNCLNMTIKNTNASLSSVGVVLAYTNNSMVESNICSNNQHGIELFCSNNNTIRQNEITGNEKGVYIAGSEHNKIVDNIVSLNIDGLYVYSSNNNITDNIVAFNSFAGIRFEGGYYGTISNSRIKRNLISNNTYGIYVWSEYGPYYSSFSYNYLEENIICYNQDGVFAEGVKSACNTIQSNSINNNVKNGLNLRGFNNNTICQNNITDNQNGIDLYRSSNNIIYHNNFINNTCQAYCNESINVWDQDYPTGGNYWSDYVGIDSNHDGIGDTEYVIVENNTDRYPLMNPWKPTAQQIVPFFSQRDPRWARDPMGESGKTIGEIGCAMTCTAMLLKYYGVETDPGKLNTWLSANDGYIADGSLIWDKPAEYSEGKIQFVHEEKFWSFENPTQSQWEKLDEELSNGHPVIIKVDADPSPETFSQHWILVTSKSDSNYYINDPWDYNFTADKTLSYYANIFYGMRFYHDISPAGQTLTFDTVWENVSYPIIVLTNSTVSTFNFTQSLAQLTFEVSGKTDTIGYCNITIPKALLKGPWMVMIGNTSWSFDSSENSTHSFLYFTYTYASTIQVAIQGTWVVPEFPPTVILPFFMLLTMLVAVFLKKRVAKTKNIHFPSDTLSSKRKS